MSTTWAVPSCCALLLLLVPRAGAQEALADEFAQVQKAIKGENDLSAAIHQLGHLRREAIADGEDRIEEAAEELLLKLIQDDKVYIVNCAVAAITFKAPRPMAGVKLLIRLLREDKSVDDPDRSKLTKRALYILGLGEYGLDAVEAIPFLIEALKDREHYTNTRGPIVRTLTNIDPRNKDVIAALRRELRDERNTANRWDMVVIANVAACLGKGGPSAKEAEPDLIALLKRVQNMADSVERDRIRSLCARSLGDIGASTATIPVLVQLATDLTDEEGLTRREAMMALVKVDTSAKEVLLPLLQIAAKAKGDLSARRVAIVALGELGPNATGALNTLTALVKDPSTPRFLLRSCEEAIEKIKGRRKVTGRYE